MANAFTNSVADYYRWARQLDDTYDPVVDGPPGVHVALELVRCGNVHTAAFVLSGRLLNARCLLLYPWERREFHEDVLRHVALRPHLCRESGQSPAPADAG